MSGVISPSTTIALTTTFTPAPGCFTALTWYEQANGPGSPRTIGPIDGCPQCWLSTPDNATCWPSSWNPGVLFSPGICPQGYTAACSNMYPGASTVEVWTTCCPTNFFCASYDSFWPWFSTEICASNYNTGGFSFAALPTPTVKFQSQTETLPATRLLGFTIYNYGIRIQPGSIPITSPSSTGTSSSPISSTGTSSAPISSTSISPAAQSKPLSSAAKAGIGVGIAFPVLILGLGAGCYYSVRRRRMLKHGHKQPSPPDLPELPNSGILDQKVEMPDNTKDEKAPLSSPPIELQGPEVNAPVAYPREPLELSATASISRRPVPAPYVPDPPLVMNEEPRVDNSISHSPPQATRVTESGNNAQEGQSDIENELAQICEERERLKRLMELDKRRQELMEKLRH